MYIYVNSTCMFVLTCIYMDIGADTKARGSWHRISLDPAASVDGREHTGLPRSGISLQILLMPRPRSHPCADSRGEGRGEGTSPCRSPTMSIPKINRDQTIQNRIKDRYCLLFHNRQHSAGVGWGNDLSLYIYKRTRFI